MIGQEVAYDQLLGNLGEDGLTALQTPELRQVQTSRRSSHKNSEVCK
jgi:hypothetical protein